MVYRCIFKRLRIPNFNPSRKCYTYSTEPFHPIIGRRPEWMSCEDAVGFDFNYIFGPTLL